ncbi:uncharacterized protein STEHIDRAFT_172033 [Stereum hirsutum FP-91666 SS1]|uniref:uncharacterized protein n=1 Tax=Stereum hirsutum (strain FP-91666) TaxID=721885 RepID=UPI00044499B0|nr:uncharacterized protein STEHIDRAFT_172033 [Stereum hirsutum FP-91666 SS1]EIM80947.1 hypothetical protein STEHIDRAFT_172033 [Stereum hirsutum FP-91666 SS1]
MPGPHRLPHIIHALYIFPAHARRTAAAFVLLGSLLNPTPNASATTTSRLPSSSPSDALASGAKREVVGSIAAEFVQDTELVSEEEVDGMLEELFNEWGAVMLGGGGVTDQTKVAQQERFIWSSVCEYYLAASQVLICLTILGSSGLKLRNFTLNRPFYSDFVHNMRFLATTIIVLGFLASAFAQSVLIGSPSDGSTVTAGQSITVDVLKPDSIQGSKDVAVIFGMSPCSAATNSCPDAASSFGQVIYGAPYHPQLNIPENSTESESFTVPVPVGFKGDKVVLSLAHVLLIGVGESSPNVDVTSITLNVV